MPQSPGNTSSLEGLVCRENRLGNLLNKKINVLGNRHHPRRQDEIIPHDNRGLVSVGRADKDPAGVNRRQKSSHLPANGLHHLHRYMHKVRRDHHRLLNHLFLLPRFKKDDGGHYRGFHFCGDPKRKSPLQSDRAPRSDTGLRNPYKDLSGRNRLLGGKPREAAGSQQQDEPDPALTTPSIRDADG